MKQVHLKRNPVDKLWYSKQVVDEIIASLPTEKQQKLGAEIVDELGPKLNVTKGGDIIYPPHISAIAIGSPLYDILNWKTGDGEDAPLDKDKFERLEKTKKKSLVISDPIAPMLHFPVAWEKLFD